MRPKLDVVKFLYRCLTLIKFEGNPEGMCISHVDLTWNDAHTSVASSLRTVGVPSK